MSDLRSQLDALAAQLRAGDSGAGDAIFASIEHASLENVATCVGEVEACLGDLAEDDPARIYCWKGLAHVLCYDNQFERAASVLADAVRLAERLGRDADRPTLQLTMVQPLERLGRVEEAEQAARSALAGFEAAGDTLKVGRAMVNLGVVRRVRGDAQDALAWFDRARPHLAPLPLALGTLETNAAEAMLDLDRHEDAIAAFTRAREVFEANDHALGAAISEGNLADVHSRLGRVDQATQLFASARARFEACDAPADAARLQAEEAEAFMLVGAHHRAVRLFEGSLDALSVPGMAIEHTRALLGLGLALLRLGAVPRALEALRRAAEHAEGPGTATLRDDVSLALARASLQAGSPADARAALGAVRGSLASRPLQQAHALLLEASLFLHAGDTARAREALDRVEGSPVAWALAPVRARTRQLRARCAPERAWDELSRALDDTERFRATLRAQHVRAAFAESFSDIFQDAIDAAIGLPDAPAHVFAAVERLRARSLLEACAGRTGAHAGAASRRAGGLSSLYAALASSPQPSADLVSRIAHEEDALERDTERSAPSAVTQHPHTLQRARELLPEGSAVVSFCVARDTLHALVIRRESAGVHATTLTRRDLASLTRRHVLSVDLATRAGASALAGAPAAAPSAAIDALSRALRPLLQHVRGVRRVAAIPCRELHALPLAGVLQDLLAEAGASVSLAPSVSSGLFLRAQSGAAAASLLSVGVADDVAPRMGEEARAVAKTHAGATLLEGPGATARAFLDALAAHDVVHVAAHCVFDAEFPMASRLRLHDRWVAARELLDCIRPGAVIVLAGCETGRTSDATGEDRFGLIRALLVGGASLVVASHWLLRDDSAAELFPRLHALARARARAGTHPCAAMIDALSDLQRDLVRTNHPWPDRLGLFAKGAIQ